MWQTCYLFRWQYMVKILIWVIYLRHSLESVIAKYSKHPHRCCDWLPHIHLKTLDSSALKPCRLTTDANKIIQHRAAIPGFQTEMATKRQNLWSVALNWYSVHCNKNCFYDAGFCCCCKYYMLMSWLQKYHKTVTIINTITWIFLQYNGKISNLNPINFLSIYKYVKKKKKRQMPYYLN